MLYTKLFELNSIGLSSNNIGKLFEKFMNLNVNSLITKDEIKSTITQKKIIDKLIDFLLENRLLEVLDKDKQNIYKIIVKVPKSQDANEVEVYKQQKLYLTQKDLIVKKLNSYRSKNGYIIKLDIANSTAENGNVKTKDILLNVEFPKFVKKSIEKDFYANNGYLIAQYGDEAFLFFFERNKLEHYINNLLALYKKELYRKFEEYNESLDTIKEGLYLKIFIAHSIISNITHDIFSMLNFENMAAMKYISRVEKPFKEQILKQKNLEISKFFIVADEQLDSNFVEEKIRSEDRQEYNIFYKIDRRIDND